MSDAGKVMIDASGNLILGAGGKAVLADDLYPMVPTQQVVRYLRQGAEGPPCAATAVWSVAWSVVDLSYMMAAYTAYENGFSLARQMVLQVKFGGNSIDWPRVKKITVAVGLNQSRDEWAAPARVTKAMNTETIPTDKTIRDTWETVFTNIDEGGIIEWDVNGVEPTSLEIAFMCDLDTCPLDVWFYGYLSNNPFRIVYNLST